ncbi:MAG: group II intron reverse transcriptase/maturase [Planctomycetaceae bacterium]
MTGQHENTPATVPLAQQAGEFPAEWQWVERGVWNARMLTALLTKGKGQKWFRLYDKVFAERNLIAAFQQVFSKHGAAGVDHVTVEEFARRSPESLWELLDELQHKTYRPQAIRRVYIPKPGTTDKRPLGIPTVRDRIVQAAVVNVIEPIFEREFAEHSYGFRPGRGCGEAVQRVTELIHSGFVYIVDADLKSYFDTIPHENLLQRISERIPDGSVLSLIRSFLNAQILEEMQMWNPEAGAPQGAVLSPLLSNIYLNPLDHLMAESGYEMVRYADDFVILCRTAEDAQRALNAVQTWVTDNGLILHPTKTKIVNVEREGFDFLGFHFIATTNYPRAKSVEKLQTALRQKTKRTRGDSLHFIIRDVNQTLRGWYGYFQISRTGSHLFRRLDSWRRMRLRSILRRRAHRRGKGRGKDHQRWPNKFFETLGLFSLHAARVVRSILSEVKPSTGEPDAGDLHVRFGGRGVSTQ